MASIVNPLTGRKIKSTGRTAKVRAVAARIDGKTARGTKRTGCHGFELCVGSKLQVWNRTAYKTSGGTTREGLFQDKNGRIRFRSRSLAAKRNPVLMAKAQEMRTAMRRR